MTQAGVTLAYFLYSIILVLVHVLSMWSSVSVVTCARTSEFISAPEFQKVWVAICGPFGPKNTGVTEGIAGEHVIRY